MKAIFYKKFLPIFVIFTDKFIPERFGGYNIGPINFVRKKYKNDSCLIEHEIFHSKQFWNNPIKYILGRWLKYFAFLPHTIIRWSETKTFEYECEAYAYQLKCIIESQKIHLYDAIFYRYLYRFAKFVSTKYNLPSYIYTIDKSKRKIFEYFTIMYNDNK